MVKHKQGDTFKLSCTVKDDGTPVDISTWTINSQVKRGDSVIDTLVVEKTDASSGEFTLTESVVGGSSDWELGEYEMDIQYTAGGIVFSTETVELSILKDVTGAS